MSDMKIRIEHLRPDPNDEGTNWSTNCKIYDEKTGCVLGAVQKVTVTYSVNDFVPKATLEVVNFESIIEGIEADVEVTLVGPACKKIDDMSHEELVEALKWEAKRHYLATLRGKELMERLKNK